MAEPHSPNLCRASLEFVCLAIGIQILQKPCSTLLAATEDSRDRKNDGYAKFIVPAGLSIF